MTPKEQTVYVDLESGEVSATLATKTPPGLNYILRAGAKLNVVFHTDGVAEELEAATTGRFVIKPISGAGDAAYFLDTAWTLAGTGEESVYTFLGEMDSTALRTALATQKSEVFTAQILWKEPSETYDGSSLPFDLTIHTNLHRSDDAAPNVSSDYSFAINTDETAIEVSINGTSKGFIHLFTTAP